MWERTIGAFLYPSAVYYDISVISRTMLSPIQWAVTEQTINVRMSLMTRIVLTCMIFKITIRIYHYFLLIFLPNKKSIIQLLFVRIHLHVFMKQSLSYKSKKEPSQDTTAHKTQKSYNMIHIQ